MKRVKAQKLAKQTEAQNFAKQAKTQMQDIKTILLTEITVHTDKTMLENTFTKLILYSYFHPLHPTNLNLHSGSIHLHTKTMQFIK